jgi:hypothetical protein
VGLAVDAFEIGELAGFADQHSQLSAFGGEGFGNVVAYKPRCACNKDLHGLESLMPS